MRECVISKQTETNAITVKLLTYMINGARSGDSRGTLTSRVRAVNRGVWSESLDIHLVLMSWWNGLLRKEGILFEEHMVCASNLSHCSIQIHYRNSCR